MDSEASTVGLKCIENTNNFSISSICTLPYWETLTSNFIESSVKPASFRLDMADLMEIAMIYCPLFSVSESIYCNSQRTSSAQTQRIFALRLRSAALNGGLYLCWCVRASHVLFDYSFTGKNCLSLVVKELSFQKN